MEEILIQIEAWCNNHASNKEDERHELYEYSVKLTNSLRLHFDYGSEIGEKVSDRRPTEPKDRVSYREKAWEPVNYSLIRKVITYLRKLYNAHLSEVEFPEFKSSLIGEREGIETYVNNLPKHGSLHQISVEQSITEINKDPHGWRAWWSEKPLGERGNNYPNPTKHYIPSEAIVDYNDDWVVFLSDEKSGLCGNDDCSEVEYSGRVYWFFLNGMTIKSEQYGRGSEYTFFATVWDAWNANIWPRKAIEMHKGTAETNYDQFASTDCKEKYVSFLQAGIPVLNRLVQIESDLDAIFALHMHPQKIEVRKPCPTCKGEKKVQLTHGLKEGEWMDCKVCSGTGVETTSLFDAYTVSEDLIERLDGKIPELVKYVEAPTEIVELAMKRKNELKIEFFQALNMAFITEAQKNVAESAMKKAFDMEVTNEFLSALARSTTRLLQFDLDAITVLRYAGVFKGRVWGMRPTVETPQDFNIETIETITAGLKDLTEIPETPSSYLQSKFINAARKEFGEDTMKFKRVRAGVMSDPLFSQDMGNIMAGFTAGLVERWKIYAHLNIDSILRELETENPDLLLMPVSEIREEVKEYSIRQAPTATIPAA